MMQVPEEPTELNIKQLLAALPKGLSPLERLILCNYGTVQTLLSVVYCLPVKIKVLSQYEFNEIIVRWTRLYIEPSGDPGQPEPSTTVCLAESIIPINDNTVGFITAIREQIMGIGQIIKATSLKTERCIQGMFADELTIARNYSIRGDVNVLITESFPRNTGRMQLILADDTVPKRV